MTTSESPSPSATDSTSPETRPFEPGEFQDHFWKRFSPKRALRILSDDRPTFHGYRGAALYAMTCWMFAPGNKELRQSAIAYAAASYLGQIERPLVEQEDGPNDQGRLLAFHVTATDFFKEIYFPVGGVAGIMAAMSRQSILKALEDARGSIDCAIEMVRVIHWRETQGPQADLYPASIKRTTETVDGLDIARARAAYDHWRVHKERISLLYAAESINIDGLTLLDCLEIGSLRKATPARIGEMVGRAHYVNQAILSTAGAEAAQDNEMYLPEMSAIPFTFDPYSEAEARTVRNEYRRDKRSEASS